MISMKIESKENSLVGSDHYRDSTVAVPRAFQPTTTHVVNMNKSGTNANVEVRNDDYVVADVDGRQLMTDRFIMTTKFTSLQAVTALEERSRIFDTHLAFLIAARDSILAGILPDAPVVSKALPSTLYK